MSRFRLEELDRTPTPWGEVVLRRRLDPATLRVVHEIKLDDDYLMSSQFTASEEALASVALDALDGAGDRGLRVVVGGLGLGCTALRVLADARVEELLVVEALQPVIDWHVSGLLPGTRALVQDRRSQLRCADFFDLVRKGQLGTGWDAVLVDIDHSPDHVLREDHADFYTAVGLHRVAAALAPHGVLGLWSDDPPDPEVVARLADCFGRVEDHVIVFDNELTQGTSRCTVYLASGPTTAGAWPA